MGNLTKYKGWGEEQAQKDQEAMNSGGTEFWKPKAGKNVVRFLPALADWDGGPFLIVREHYVNTPTGVKNFPCPKALANRSCPVCVRADQLKASGKKKDDDLAYQLFAKKQVYAHIVDRKEPDKGVQLFKFGKKIFGYLSTLKNDEDLGGDFTIPTDEGYDIIIIRDGEGRKTTYEVHAGKNKALHKKEVKMIELIESQSPHRPPRLYTSDQIMEMISGVPADDDAVEEDDSADDDLEWE